jgi:hypothetical protein
MTSKILTGAMAFALATTAGLATTAPASARHAHWNPGYVAADAAGSLIGGALATATTPFWATGYYGYPASYSPDYAYGPGYTYAPAYGYGYRRYGRYRGYYGYGRYRRCFQTCPDR